MTNVLFLADLEVIKPDPGLILWTSVVFLLVYGLLSRFAFRPIQQALQKREQDIQNSLDEAKRAREDMANLKAANEELLRQAQEERVKILKEAKEAKESIISEAREKAKQEARKVAEVAKQDIEHQKMEAIVDLKNQVGAMSLQIAERILRKELQGDKAQEEYAQKLVQELDNK